MSDLTLYKFLFAGLSVCISNIGSGTAVPSSEYLRRSRVTSQVRQEHPTLSIRDSVTFISGLLKKFIMNTWGPFSLEGKRAVVTGAAMGIGRGIVYRYVEAGAQVLCVDIAEDKMNATANELVARGAKVSTLRVDLLDDDAPEKIVSAAVSKLGGIDVLVNNAGIYPTVPMMNMTRELFDKVYRLNLRALAFLSREAARQMIKQGGGGKIINIASIDSVHPSSIGLAAYDASKGGVLMFTKNFALEMAPHGILVNAIAPGGIATEGSGLAQSSEQMKAALETFVKRIPTGRIGQPDDIAKVAVFLASSASDYMTGSLVVVDGGVLLS